MPLCTDEAGRNFIAANEGLVLTVSNDIGHPAIGYGHDLLPAEIASGIFANGINTLQAQLLLENDCDKWDEAINALNWPLNQNQHNALADFTHNLGVGALRQLAAHGQSRICYQLYHEDTAGGQHGWIFEKDQHGNEVVSPGLVARRLKDIALYNKPC